MRLIKPTPFKPWHIDVGDDDVEMCLLHLLQSINTIQLRLHACVPHLANQLVKQFCAAPASSSTESTDCRVRFSIYTLTNHND